MNKENNFNSFNGVIKQVFPCEEKTLANGHLNNQCFLIISEINVPYPQSICVKVWGENATKDYHEGMHVHVGTNCRSYVSKAGLPFTDIVAWKIYPINVQQALPAPPTMLSLPAAA